ncbi:helix-turn-helix domain-containing protein [Algoriphagus resistens]|uniref:helix-turn-helix domain-containing protein n=1 Tax=Algoriphagus resistens TaxID=1750590 RepID=UPI0009EC0CBF
MKSTHRSYKVMIYLTKEQASLLGKHSGHCSFAFNRFLNKRKEKYLNEKKT